MDRAGNGAKCNQMYWNRKNAIRVRISDTCNLFGLHLHSMNKLRFSQLQIWSEVRLFGLNTMDSGEYPNMDFVCSEFECNHQMREVVPHKYSVDWRRSLMLWSSLSRKVEAIALPAIKLANLIHFFLVMNVRSANISKSKRSRDRRHSSRKFHMVSSAQKTETNLRHSFKVECSLDFAFDAATATKHFCIFRAHLTQR